MDFLQARWFRAGRQGHAIRLFVIHDMEAPEKSTTAEAVARYFSTTDRKASAHYCIDSDSVVQCVHDGDTAFGAAGANLDGLHFEQAGYARQTEAEWLDPYGLAMFGHGGVVLRAKSKEHGVPLRWLSDAEIKDGRTRGLCTHGDISRCFPASSTGHTDPGPNFPRARALAIWQGVPPVQEDDDMPQVLTPAAPNSEFGYAFLVGNGMRFWITNGDDLKFAQAQYGEMQTVPSGYWDRVVKNTTATDIQGLRNLPPEQRGQLAQIPAIHDAVVKK